MTDDTIPPSLTGLLTSLVQLALEQRAKIGRLEARVEALGDLALIVPTLCQHLEAQAAAPAAAQAPPGEVDPAAAEPIQAAA